MATAARKMTAIEEPMPQMQDAIKLLRADHKLVNDLFEQFESARGTSKKKTLVAQICMELTIHAQIEEEIFYPAVQRALKDKTLIPEARVEHDTLKYLIAQIVDAETDSELYEAKVTVLSEYVKHHVKEEQNEIFPKVKESKLDLMELGGQLAMRKEELMAQIS
jgi:hemerythrin superfamily protein